MNLDFTLERSPPRELHPTLATVVGFVALFSCVSIGLFVGGLAGGQQVAGGVLGAIAGVAIGGYLYRSSRSQAVLPPVVVAEEWLDIPRSSWSQAVDRVPLVEVDDISVRGRGRSAQLVIGTQRRLYWLLCSTLAESDSAKRLRREVYRRLLALPEGPAHLVDQERRAQFEDKIMARPPRITWLLLTLLGAFHVLQSLTGALDPNPVKAAVQQIILGANVPTLVRDGQWFRLVTANFLHAPPILFFPLHILLNSVAILSLGGFLERLIGPVRMLLIYLVAAVAGSAASTWAAQGTMSIGASTAVFGLFGAFVVLTVRHYADLPVGFRQSRRWWVVVLTANAALAIVFRDYIDSAAHGGGLVGGVLVTLALFAGAGRLTPGEPSGKAARIALAGCVLGFIFGFVQCLGWARNPSMDPRDALDHAVLASERDPGFLNYLAWTAAIDPEAAPHRLSNAMQFATRAVELVPDESALNDTLSTVHFRLGELDAAVESQLKTLRLEDRGVYWTQLERFVRERRLRSGAWGRGGLDPTDFEVGLNADGVELRSTDFPFGPLLVLAWVHQGGDSLGLLHIGGKFDRNTELRRPFTGEQTRAIARGLVSVDVVLVEALDALPAAFEGVRLHSPDAEVRDLPGPVSTSSIALGAALIR